MTPWKSGYIDGLKGNVQRYKFKSKKFLRKYNNGYAKGLGTWYFRDLMRLTKEKNETNNRT